LALPCSRGRPVQLVENRHLAMIVAVVAIRMMQMPGYQIVDVVAMGNGHMPAIDSMLMVLIMAVTLMAIRAICRVGSIYLDRVLIHMTFVRRVQVPVMQIVGVIVVLNGRMAAILAMLMGMIFVNFVLSSHKCFSFVLG
jgi:hypothetical protein